MPWAAQPDNATKPPQVVVTLDRADALYEIGDTVEFTIAVAYEDGSPVKGTMNIQLGCSLDRGRPLSGNWVEDDGEPKTWVRRETQTWLTIEDGGSETIEYTLEEPGFARLTAIGRSWRGEREYIKSIAVAGCEPEKIEPVVTMPDDFDAFWQKGRERLAEIPLDYQQERIDHLCNETHDVFKVSFENINNTRIHGYLLVPRTGKEKYPGFVAVAPAGVGKPREDFIEGGMNNISRDQAICLYMGVYGHDLGKPREFYRNYKSPDGGVRAATGEPQEYFFYRAILGIDRAISWLAAREDVDDTHLVYKGNSQGGGMGLILTGLNKNITAASVNIPGLCDHVAFRAGRLPGWPQVLGRRRRRKMSDAEIEKVAEMLRYFDAVNFARKIDVPVIVSMGFQDTTCPPNTVYAAYNVIDAPKQIVTNPQDGHHVSKAARSVFVPCIRRELGLAEKQ